jgi:excisionase family DNA binding protein
MNDYYNNPLRRDFYPEAIEVYVMDGKPDDILTIEELSVYLKISKSTLYKLLREGRIPSHKVGRHWRFRKETIDRWLDEKRIEEPDIRGK